MTANGCYPEDIRRSLRQHNYPEVFDEINAFDGEIVFSKPVVPPAKKAK